MGSHLVRASPAHTDPRQVAVADKASHLALLPEDLHGLVQLHEVPLLGLNLLLHLLHILMQQQLWGQLQIIWARYVLCVIKEMHLCKICRLVSADAVLFACVLMMWQQAQDTLQVGQPGQYAFGHAIGITAALGASCTLCFEFSCMGCWHLHTILSLGQLGCELAWGPQLVQHQCKNTQAWASCIVALVEPHCCQHPPRGQRGRTPHAPASATLGPAAGSAQRSS